MKKSNKAALVFLILSIISDISVFPGVSETILNKYAFAPKARDAWINADPSISISSDTCDILSLSSALTTGMSCVDIVAVENSDSV